MNDELKAGRMAESVEKAVRILGWIANSDSSFRIRDLAAKARKEIEWVRFDSSLEGEDPLSCPDCGERAVATETVSYCPNYSGRPGEGEHIWGVGGLVEEESP